MCSQTERAAAQDAAIAFLRLSYGGAPKAHNSSFNGERLTSTLLPLAFRWIELQCTKLDASKRIEALQTALRENPLN